jgi:HD-GYP domain-containing protein (c-di-GMP phosphodiesterase class II)
MLEQGASTEPMPTPVALRDITAPLELIADVIDLKLPWMTGYSRRVAEAAQRCAAGLGLDAAQQQRIYRAGLIHGIGRASVPNAVWDSPGVRSEADAERLRLVPYWTERAARRIDTLRDEAGIASFVDERLDGSGFFRGVKGAAIDTEGRVLAAAAHWVALRTARPGKPALTEVESIAALRAESDGGRLDAQAVALLTGHPQPAAEASSADAAALLSGREVEVLGRISLGESNKEAARSLGISPSTVRAHLENIFRKLGCTTRAAATLKAMTLGLL